jgi:hypothetical protein
MTDRIGMQWCVVLGFCLWSRIDSRLSPMPQLILKRASASRPSGEWNDDDFDVLADGTVVGRIFKANAAPVGSPWMWTLAFGHHEDRSPTHGYAETREGAMAAFAKSWRRGASATSQRHTVGLSSDLIGRLSAACQRSARWSAVEHTPSEPVVAGGHFRGRTAVVT